MKARKKLWMSALLSIAAMMILGTACGGGDSEEENTNDTTVAQDTSGQSDIAQDQAGEKDLLTPEDLLGDEMAVDGTVLSDVQEDLGNEDLAVEDLAVEDLAVEDLAVEDIPIAPMGHTEDMGGVMHYPGKADALANCTSCHGGSLEGGVGPSCYTCHNNDDHTKSHGGHKHKSGSSSSCAACHGPNNTGGLGPACSTCH